jgi:hypothetical protein
VAKATKHLGLDSNFLSDKLERFLPQNFEIAYSNLNDQGRSFPDWCTLGNVLSHPYPQSFED